MSLLELFGWAGWQSRDRDKSENAVDKITNQKKLAKIARKAPLRETKILAINKITDQKRLAKIATKALNFNTRILAIEKLDEKHQELFADIVLSDRDIKKYGIEKVHEEAVKKLTDQRLLSLVIAKYKNNYHYKDIFSLAVENLTDQNVLSDIAENGRKHPPYLRFKAIEKLTDKILAQKIYAGIAENDEENGETRIEAAEKLTNQTLTQKVYVDVIKKYQYMVRDSYELERLLTRLFAKITDQNTLVDFAKNSEGTCCWLSVKQLSDQELLADVAKYAENCYVRWMAAEKLTDKTNAEEVYFDLLYKSDSRDDGEKAIMKITDQRALATIAKSVTLGVYKEFIGENDYSEGYKMAGSYGYLREIAIKKLTDQDVLAEIANGDEESYVYNGSINHQYFTDEYVDGYDYPQSKINDKWENDTLDLRETARKRMIELDYPVP